jgi:hypothetical protein
MKSIYHSIYSLLLICMFTATANASEDREWSFRVLLDGKHVGSQRFVLTGEGGKTRLETEADFKVKIMFLTVYRYSHRNVGTWEGDCLTDIQSTTDANGKPFAVNGQQRDGFFEVSGDGQSEKLPECVVSFAYWNPSFLENSRLLNSQNGEYLDVEVSSAEPDFRTIRGEKVAALRYHLSAGELDLQLWYSTENEWLALESRTKGDRILSYELL